MIRKVVFPTYFNLYIYVSFFVLFFSTITVSAQCAGSNNGITVCDIANVSSQAVDLAALLGPHTTGGTWKDDDKSGGLNKTNGILNVQQVKKSGIYHYTYTVIGCPLNTAVITVTIGGYTGVPGANTSICNTNGAFNLFQVFNGNFLAPQIGGTWSDDDASGGLNPATGVLDATKPIPDDTYSYTYTISAIGSCVAPPPSQIFVSIYRSPEPGTATNLNVCSNQLAPYTNVDLNSRLTGEDADGSWEEFGTSELSDDTDSFINVQNIYNTKGPGTYTFTYTVVSNNTVCVDQSTSVTVTIEKQLDFTGTTLVVNSDICENEIPTATYQAVLTQGAQVIADGLYDVTYLVTGATFPVTIIGNFVSGVFNFNIPSSNFQVAKDYTISIQNIKPANIISVCTSIKGTIEDVLHITPIPKINTATLTIVSVCKVSDVIVNFGGTSNLSDGDYDIHYNLTGSNTLVSTPYRLNIIGGAGTIRVPKTFVPNTGQTTISITDIKKINTNCPNTSTLSQSFTINPLPDITNLNIIINDVCLGQPTTVELSGLEPLTTIEISYSLLGANQAVLKTIPLTVVAGNASFDILASELPSIGVTTFNMSSIKNTVNGCPLAMNKTVDFTVNGSPDVSNLAIIIKDGCPNRSLNVDITGLGVLTNITLNYKLSGVNSATLQTSALIVAGGKTNFLIPGSALSITGTSTIVITDLTNTITGCSSLVNSISQNFDIVPIPNNPIATNQEFCKEDFTTVASLVPNGNLFTWYDSPNSATPLLPSTLLVTGNYYLREVNATGCESNATTVGILINSVPTPILSPNGQDFCGVDKPTIQNLSNNTSYMGILTWYDTPSNGTALSNTQLLIEGETYYGIDYNTTTTCISTPLEVIISLTDCTATAENFVIPDGFSPNSDGVNDTFEILDIEFLYPNYTLEIFNRYGNVLFKGNISKPAWDGKNSNSNFINGESPAGVYFYIINYNKGNLPPKQGKLYLNR